ncbi:MAG: hypothetical protein IKU52_05695 [Clostridia bacterium]|nr:hypothetical protein [Clostridia bacterium]
MPKSGTVEFLLIPTVILFTLWVLQNAKKKGIKTLFFLARDGYPSYIIAKKLCQKYDLGIECKYFYCSRYSLRVPMYSEDIGEALSYICRNGIDVTFNKILIRSGFSNEQSDHFRSVFNDIDFNKVLSYSELSYFKERLMSCDEYIKLLNEVSTNARKGLKAYFTDRGMLGEDIAIADSGWTGTTQRSINAIRRYFGCKTDVIGFYFGLFEVPADCCVKDYNYFYFGPKKGLKNKVFFSNCLYEALFHANSGTTLGYKIEHEAVPVLDEYILDEYNESFLNTLENYTDYMIDSNSLNGLFECNTDKYKTYLGKSLRKFMWSPTKGEAEFFGKLRFSDDLLDNCVKEVAPIFSDEYLKENHFLNKLLCAYGIRKKAVHESAWYEASVVRNGKHLLRHKCSYSLYRMLSYIKKGL